MSSAPANDDYPSGYEPKKEAKSISTPVQHRYNLRSSLNKNGSSITQKVMSAAQFSPRISSKDEGERSSIDTRFGSNQYNLKTELSDTVCGSDSYDNRSENIDNKVKSDHNQDGIKNIQSILNKLCTEIKAISTRMDFQDQTLHFQDQKLKSQDQKILNISQPNGSNNSAATTSEEDKIYRFNLVFPVPKLDITTSSNKRKFVKEFLNLLDDNHYRHLLSDHYKIEHIDMSNVDGIDYDEDFNYKLMQNQSKQYGFRSDNNLNNPSNSDVNSRLLSLEQSRRHPDRNVVYGQAESWLPSTMLNSEYTKRVKFFNIDKNRYDTLKEFQFRMTFWKVVTAKVDDILYDDLNRGDIKSLYTLIVNEGSTDSTTQIGMLMFQLLKLDKVKYSMM